MIWSGSRHEAGRSGGLSLVRSSRFRDRASRCVRAADGGHSLTSPRRERHVDGYRSATILSTGTYSFPSSLYIGALLVAMRSMRRPPAPRLLTNAGTLATGTAASVYSVQDSRVAGRSITPVRLVRKQARTVRAGSTLRAAGPASPIVAASPVAWQPFSSTAAATALARIPQAAPSPVRIVASGFETSMAPSSNAGNDRRK